MNKKNIGLALTWGALTTFSAGSLAQGLSSDASGAWQISAHVAEESVGQGLPVLALGRSDWSNYLPDQIGDARAFRSLKAELQATHPSGWRIAALARAQAWLQANADAVTLAALEANGADPAVANRYSPQASSQSWQGQGIKVGTPWLAVGTTGQWQWQADAELLQLQQLRTDELSGALRYQGAGVYDFDLHSQRSNTGIASPFLSASGSTGVGATLSLGLQGQLAPGWRAEFRADDLFSRLLWPDLATDTSALNSQVTSRAPDGSLNYAPLLTGQKSLQQVSAEIGTHWQARLAWSAFEYRHLPGALTLHVASKAGIHQSWLGWDNGETAASRLRWRIAFEPSWRAAKLELAWAGWHMLAATDGKGLASQYRGLRMEWRTVF